MSSEWVLIELSEPAAGAAMSPPVSIGVATFAIVPRDGEYVVVKPEQETSTAIFQVVAVRHAPDDVGDLYLRRIGEAVEFDAALRARLIRG